MERCQLGVAHKKNAFKLPVKRNYTASGVPHAGPGATARAAYLTGVKGFVAPEAAAAPEISSPARPDEQATSTRHVLLYLAL